MTDISKCHSLELLDKESGDTVQCTVYSVQCTVPFKETALEVLRSRNRKKKFYNNNRISQNLYQPLRNIIE